MIGDHDQQISKAYDVLWPLVGLTRRVTYVIGPKRRIEAVFHHELNIQQHRDDVLRFINRSGHGTSLMRELPLKTAD